jgi:hypothetical protein
MNVNACEFSGTTLRERTAQVIVPIPRVLRSADRTSSVLSEAF